MTTQPASDAQREVRAHAQRWLEATMRADADALDALLSPDYTYQHTSGNLDARDVWLESFRTGGRIYQVYAIHDEQFRHYPGVIVMTGKSHQEMNTGGNQRELNAHFTSIWVQQDGEWKLALWHATRQAEA